VHHVINRGNGRATIFIRPQIAKRLHAGSGKRHSLRGKESLGMDKKRVLEILSRFRNAIEAQHVMVDKLVLFGSYAACANREGSDMRSLPCASSGTVFQNLIETVRLDQLPFPASNVLTEHVNAPVIPLDPEVTIIRRHPTVNDASNLNRTLTDGESPWCFLAPVTGVAFDCNLHNRW
jgi:hypothetical protein